MPHSLSSENKSKWKLRDLIVTPLVIFAVYAMAYAARPYVADQVTGRYYFPALSLKIIGAIALGFCISSIMAAEILLPITRTGKSSHLGGVYGVAGPRL